MTIFNLSENCNLLRQTASHFAQQEIAPRAEKIDQTNEIPRTLWPVLGAHGLLGITVDAEFGGSGMGYLEEVIAMEEISRASASVGLSYAAHANLCINPISRYGNQLQKMRYLPKLIDGKHIGALAIHEAHAGSDVNNMQLTATHKKDHFILNGTKMWVTNGAIADIFIVYAKTDPAAGAKGITAFLIEKGFKGFRNGEKLDTLGMRGSNTSELIFENCEVSTENILGKLNEGMNLLTSSLNHEHLVLAAGPVGIMQACLDIALPYVKQHKQFGQSIGEFEFIQGKIADMYVALNTSRAYLYAVAAACDDQKIIEKDAAAVILYTAEQATQMALQVIQCLGAHGYASNNAAGRLLRDAKLYEIAASTAEMRRGLIARELLKD
jgi:isovaleryl-CoA dehydrogenase